MKKLDLPQELLSKVPLIVEDLKKNELTWQEIADKHKVRYQLVHLTYITRVKQQ